MRKIILIFGMAWMASGVAQELTPGYGEAQDRSKALLYALKDAMVRRVGGQMTVETVMRNFVIQKDEVRIVHGGKISSFHIVEEHFSAQMHQIWVECQIDGEGMASLKENLKSRLRHVRFGVECRVKDEGVDEEDVEVAAIQELTQAGFRCIRQAFDKRMKRIADESLIPKKSFRAFLLTDPQDIDVVVSLKLTPLSSLAPFDLTHRCQMKAVAGAYNDTGEVLALASFKKEVAFSPQERETRYEEAAVLCASRATRELIEQMTREIMEDRFQEYTVDFQGYPQEDHLRIRKFLRKMENVCSYRVQETARLMKVLLKYNAAGLVVDVVGRMEKERLSYSERREHSNWLWFKR